MTQENTATDATATKVEDRQLILEALRRQIRKGDSATDVIAAAKMLMSMQNIRP